MRLLERVQRAKLRAGLQAILVEYDEKRLRRERTIKAIESSKDGGLLVHVAIERGQA